MGLADKINDAMSLKNFDAKKAKEIVESTKSGEIYDILIKIKEKAEMGESVLHLYEPLNNITLTTLENKGFSVIKSPSIATQKDGLYYSIFW